MLEAGVVTKLEGARAKVLMQRNSACAACGMCHNLAHETRDLLLDAANPEGAAVGDVVKISVPDIGVVRASFLAYGVPMLAAVAAGIVGWFASTGLGGSGEVGATVGGLAGLAVALYGVSRYDRRMRQTWAGPTVVEIMHRAGPFGQVNHEGREEPQ